MQQDRHRQQMVSASSALPGRAKPVRIPDSHYVTDNWLKAPFPLGVEQAMFAMGHFWLPEFLYWQQNGIYSTAVGYASGYTPNPSHEEVSSSQTGHAEVVLVAYNPDEISYARLLKIFWECHNPTQSMRQGEDVGTQYCSVIYYFNQQQQQLAERSLAHYQVLLSDKGFGEITTAIEPASEMYYAEQEHQQYLAKNPDCDCDVKGVGVACGVESL